ncbi:hypothetical protein BV25DRAFT_1914937 [Artomyces pyxidatus]|uniref:Uncharacterized protein n=1 Tax=Artomyces pyxidatus TaxID=48021 RepID=A0ACB8T5R2_9AGAM|nr:hypothetical protein BV25DRAFT_1914937 [Artomyces pyxidatus]
MPKPPPHPRPSAPSTPRHSQQSVAIDFDVFSIEDFDVAHDIPDEKEERAHMASHYYPLSSPPSSLGASPYGPQSSSLSLSSSPPRFTRTAPQSPTPRPAVAAARNQLGLPDEAKVITSGRPGDALPDEGGDSDSDRLQTMLNHATADVVDRYDPLDPLYLAAHASLLDAAYPNLWTPRGATGANRPTVGAIGPTAGIIGHTGAELDGEDNGEDDSPAWISNYADTIPSYSSVGTVVTAARRISTEGGFSVFKVRRRELRRVEREIDRMSLGNIRWDTYWNNKVGILTASTPHDIHEVLSEDVLHLFFAALEIDPVQWHAMVRAHTADTIHHAKTVSGNPLKVTDFAMTVADHQDCRRVTRFILEILFSQQTSDAKIKLMEQLVADRAAPGGKKIKWVGMTKIDERRRLAFEHVYPMEGVDYRRAEELELLKEINTPWSSIAIPRPPPGTTFERPPPPVVSDVLRQAMDAIEERAAAKRKSQRKRKGKGKGKGKKAKQAKQPPSATTLAAMEEAKELDHQVWFGAYTISADFYRIDTDEDVYLLEPTYHIDLDKDDEAKYNEYIDILEMIYNEVREVVFQEYKDKVDDNTMKENFRSLQGNPVYPSNPDELRQPIKLPRSFENFWKSIFIGCRETAYRRIKTWVNHPDPAPIIGQKRRRDSVSSEELDTVEEDDDQGEEAEGEEDGDGEGEEDGDGEGDADRGSTSNPRPVRRSRV